MKERILEVAHAILSTEGQAALTTRRVCEAVGVTMPTLYHYFANRDALVNAVYALALERFMAKKRSLALSEDPIDDLRRSCELVLDFTAKNLNIAAAVMSRALEDPALLVPGYELLRERVQRAAPLLSVSEREATAMLWSVVQGLVYAIIASPDRSLAGVRKRTLAAVLAAVQSA